MSDALERANQIAVRTEFLIASQDAGVLDSALDDAFTLADLSGVTIDEEGNVSGVKEVVDALFASKPYLFAERKKSMPKQIGEPSGYEYPAIRGEVKSGKSPRTGKEYGASRCRHRR